MEPSPSPSQPPPPPPLPPPRSILAIDLNEVPSPSETLLSPTAVVRSIHGELHPPPDPAATIPGGGDGGCPGCGAAPLPDDLLLVCDGCERGFHLPCAGIAAALVPVLEEWVCRHCSDGGAATQRWPLGRTRALDINSSPPSDGGPAAPDGGGEIRRHSLSDNTSGGHMSGGSLSYSNLFYPGNSFGFHSSPGIVTHTVKLDFQEVQQHRHPAGRSVKDFAFSSQLGRIRSKNTNSRFPSWNPNDILQSLKEFISERHGVLEEGWRVEFKQSKNGCEYFAVYCAPDGKTFESMPDVACYLGLASNGNLVESESRSNDVSASRWNGLPVPKRRKLTRDSLENCVTEDKFDSISGFTNGFPSKAWRAQLSVAKCGKTPEVVKAVQDENGATDSHQFHEGLPLQYEDFFILSLGKVDVRASYHDARQIWPVGYRSCWHDKLTGSLFLCDVLDGGDGGPIFKVRRFSCSALPIPYGSTVLSRQSDAHLGCSGNEERGKLSSSEEDCCVEMILADPWSPEEADALSRLLNSSIVADGQEAGHPMSQDVQDCDSSVGEKIGEFSVDGHSAASVWSILSQKLTDACSQIYKQTGTLKFFCKHVNNGIPSFCDVINENNKGFFSSLDKFCSFLGSLKVPSVVKSNDELDSTLERLRNWMKLDRFGLDTEFVQELIEQCSEVHKCSRFEYLRRRSGYSKLPLVVNELLLINGRSIQRCKQDTLMDGLYGSYKFDKEPASVNHSLPPGKHLGSKLPPHLVGDVLEVWDFFCRFHEVLFLEPMSFDELEAELHCTWFESLSVHRSCGMGPPAGLMSSDGSGIPSEQTTSSSCEIDLAESTDMENAGVREEAQGRLELSTSSKCARVSLTRLHMSLLHVLLSELREKLTTVVDRSTDGESKSKRGRKKDDWSILAMKPKFDLLPINEVTWLELARRYIIAVLYMDDNLDFAETEPHEWAKKKEADVDERAKVLSCLQGDGGVLCGSLAGVAGIEADAQLLADATRSLYRSVDISSENGFLIIEDDEAEPVNTSGKAEVGDGDIPEWAQVLEPVRKLPTNVGTRIRKCVYEALEKDPPDWARKILEHSISKEVYKGNASGPTKKAVLSVLADVVNESSQQKAHKARKKKISLSISDIIMRQCRIVLRRVASADEKKMVCNLVGRNMLNSFETNEDGLLGSPATVSRPLDFRTIDLRLAFGAYGGSHEAFFEDVQELWSNIRTAHVEQPEELELAETLSHEFQSLYEQEVVALAWKLKQYSQLGELSCETKKDIHEILASTSSIPKAPWEEAVCKICGIDKDDCNVLLCDKCEGAYHFYCLSPPLSGVPEGNWYCPSCVSVVSSSEGVAKGVKFIGQRHQRRYRSEGIQNHWEEFGRLASLMERKDYWEFSIDEKILLLKLLCNEVLNSRRVHLYLKSCRRISEDLQQKLRLLNSGWKDLKVQEKALATSAAKVSLSASNVVGELNVEGKICAAAKSTVGAGFPQAVNESRDSSATVSGPKARGVLSDQNGFQSVKRLEKNFSYKSGVKQSGDSDCQVDDDIDRLGNGDGASPGSLDLHERPSKRHKTSFSHDASVSNTLTHETDGLESESSSQDRICEHDGVDVCSASKSEDLEHTSVSSDLVNTVAAENIPSTPNELQNCNQDLSAVKKNLSSLQQSIASTELQLLKTSGRMEYLGNDSSGRLYWVSSQPGGRPWVIVDATVALLRKAQGLDGGSIVSRGLFCENPAPYLSRSPLNFGGSSVDCPFVYGRDCSTLSCPQWMFYESDAEVSELLRSLMDTERKLKNSIENWLKRFHKLHQMGKQDEISDVVLVSAEECDVLGSTKASVVLKKGGKKLRRMNNEKLYRCKCLEPIWPSRSHCLLCHTTFFTAEELDNHNNGDCRSTLCDSGTRKPGDEHPGWPSVKNSETQHQLAAGLDRVREPGTTESELSRFMMCPYNFDEIRSKFVTNDSIKELVHGIGLIGLKGTPSLVPSVSLYLSDPTLTVLPRNTTVVPLHQSKDPEKTVEIGDQVVVEGNANTVAEFCPHRFPAQKHGEDFERGGNSSNQGNSVSSVVGLYCTVPERSLRPFTGRSAQILRQIKISLLDMEAALPEEFLRMGKGTAERRRSWRSFVKEAKTIHEMVQATVVLEDWMKSKYLENKWWYWSSLSAARKTSTLSSLALRIYALDAAIVYERSESDTGSLKSCGEVDQQSLSNLNSPEKPRQTRRSTRRRKDSEG